MRKIFAVLILSLMLILSAQNTTYNLTIDYGTNLKQLVVTQSGTYGDINVTEVETPTGFTLTITNNSSYDVTVSGIYTRQIPNSAPITGSITGTKGKLSIKTGKSASIAVESS